MKYKYRLVIGFTKTFLYFSNKKEGKDFIKRYRKRNGFYPCFLIRNYKN